MTRTTLPLLLLLAACGGGTTEGTQPSRVQPHPETVVVVERETPPPAPEPSPWERLDAGELREYVLNAAIGELPEVQPGFDPTQLAAYCATPASAPELSGRAVERLMDIAIVELAAGNLDGATCTVALVRQRAKNRNDAFAGATVLAEAARRRAGDDTEAQRDAIAGVFRELPRARFGTATLVYRLFQTEEQLTANLAEIRSQLLSRETARSAIYFSQVLPEIVRARPSFMEAIELVQGENDRRRPDRNYRFSTVDLARERNATPVVVAVWDTGTNPELFQQQLFTNDQEQENGRDDDGNGQVDDIHGIVSDGNAPNTALLYQPDAQMLEHHKPFLQGVMDLRAGLASTEAATRVLELLRSITDADELERLETNLDAVGEWAHGTHVAGIMLAQNPHARLAVFRSAWAGEARPYHHRGPTDEELAAERRNVDAIVEFINRHHVKVVNASLGFTLQYIESQLRYEQDRYPTEEAVKARAAQVHAHRTETWRSVFTRCPDTLFVIAAGNDNHDVVEYEDAPASLDLPNVLAVGAVDQYGNWATFTNSNPERVRIFDFGVAVPSVVPSGETVPLSGTSMASPNVANLAGKLYAVNPNLTPQQAIAIIVETGTAIAAPFNGRIANENAAVTRARRERTRTER